jgi:hypothetical protein
MAKRYGAPMSFWDKLRKGPPKTLAPAQANPAPRWIAARDNRFGKEVLDLSAVAGSLVATTTDPANAQRAVSWQGSTGGELSGDMPVVHATHACELGYPTDGPLPALGAAAIPAVSAPRETSTSAK